jgi:hypothetical protein
METTTAKLAKLTQEVDKMELKDQRIILDIINIILERDQIKKQLKDKNKRLFPGNGSNN